MPKKMVNDFLGTYTSFGFTKGYQHEDYQRPLVRHEIAEQMR